MKSSSAARLMACVLLSAGGLAASRHVTAEAELTRRFLDAAGQSGLRFVHDNGSTGQFYMPELLRAGVALFDYDNDGDPDVYLVQGAPIDGSRPNTGNRLFRNDGLVGHALQFTDVTERAGVGLKGIGMGLAVGDIDGDGFQDLYVTNFGS